LINPFKGVNNMTTAPLTLATLLGDYPNTHALRAGEITDPRMHLQFADVETASKAFKRVVRDFEFDVAELAVVTFLSAKSYDKPLVLLPIVVRGKFQHESIVCRAGEPCLRPQDLAGKRVGVRSHSVTTVTWVRGWLESDFGVDLDSVKWITYEDPHVPEIEEPAEFERAPKGVSMMDMLLAGDIDAAVMTGAALKDPRVQLLLPDHKAAAKAWYDQHQAVPINHMIVIKQEVLDTHPWLAQALFDLFVEAKQRAGLPSPGSLDNYPLGVEANRKSLEAVIDLAYRQGLIKTRFEVDELFDERTRHLGA
jgi:4,5-dihydroxyphthalate decarboxylase